MSDVAISVSNLGKRYSIHIRQQRPKTLAGLVKHTLNAPFEYLQSTLRPPNPDETLWALRNVSFEVKEGEIIGVIGRNGAGKSTLLKILSRITKPTEGEARIRGRVGSLIEVGTGFHPELTGRENVYLNGSILGMRRNEIDRQFDAIVNFAGVEKFIDTPVKFYSSGMFVRLGFAVAAHLQPEVLLVDEVLSVGDAEFQKKCLGKMEDVARGGRTVFFVSHNMATVENLCGKSFFFDHGTLVTQGPTPDVIQEYLNRVLPQADATKLLDEQVVRQGSGRVRFSSFHVEDMKGRRIAAARSGQDINLVFGYTCDTNSQPPRQVSVGFGLLTQREQPLFLMYTTDVGQDFSTIPVQGYFRCTIRNLPLKAGRYIVDGRIVVSGVEADWLRNGVGHLDVAAGDFYGTGLINYQDHPAPMLVRGDWTVQETIDYSREVL